MSLIDDLEKENQFADMNFSLHVPTKAKLIIISKKLGFKSLSAYLNHRLTLIVDDPKNIEKINQYIQKNNVSKHP